MIKIMCACDKVPHWLVPLIGSSVIVIVISIIIYKIIKRLKNAKELNKNENI